MFYLVFMETFSKDVKQIANWINVSNYIDFLPAFFFPLSHKFPCLNLSTHLRINQPIRTCLPASDIEKSNCFRNNRPNNVSDYININIKFNDTLNWSPFIMCTCVNSGENVDCKLNQITLHLQYFWHSYLLSYVTRNIVCVDGCVHK